MHDWKDPSRGVSPTCNRLCLLLPPFVPPSAASSCFFKSDGTWYNALAKGLITEPCKLEACWSVLPVAMTVTVLGCYLRVKGLQ